MRFSINSFLTIRRLSSLLLILIGHNSIFADVKPSTMFGDNMVIQRGMPVAIWGKCDPGENIEVSFGKHNVKTNGNKNGKWQTFLPKLNASKEEKNLTIKGKNTIVFKNVVVGEVWVCAGQSNMQYGWGKESHPMFNWGGVPELKKYVAMARNKPIRSYHVPVNVSFEPLDECKGTWKKEVPGSAVAFGYAYYLQESLNIPVGIITTCWGSSSIEGWMPYDMTKQLPHFKEMMDKFKSSKQSNDRVKNAIKMGIRHGMTFVRKQPNLLYNAMLHPIIPYTCRGVVWYQGEANGRKPKEYSQSLPSWIQRLRKGWENEQLQFLIVVLPGYGYDVDKPYPKSWSWFREVQMDASKITNVEVINTIDLGDSKEIHPADKEPICKRLSLIAQNAIYNKPTVDRGPVFKNYQLLDNKIIIRFDHAKKLKTIDGKAPSGFWIAEKEGVWHKAEAIVEGNKVILSSKKLNKPIVCRYAFSGKPTVNLINEVGLPTYPFRTDGWNE